MCGIAGIFSYSDSSHRISRDELLIIRDAMVHRGPDDQGIWFSKDNRVGFAHRRLSIIDPGPSGHQPMMRGSLCITYNGEIYNYKTLKLKLEKLGHQFVTDSDTEVILALYSEYGDSMLSQLSGMFAMAIWDSEKEKLLLARDPYGIKPLYYSDENGQLAFASSVKALNQSKLVSSETSAAAEVAFLMLGYIPEPITILEQVSSIRAGHYMVWQGKNNKRSQCFADISDPWTQAGLSILRNGNTAIEPDLNAISTYFKQSVDRHLVSDVPVGLFLSSGIDSGAIAGLAAELLETPMQSATLRFEEFVGTAQDESQLASAVAKAYGLNHHEYTVSKREFDSDLPAYFNAMDQPTVDGLNTWFISKAASELGIKVMLSGVGGDELLGSYPSFTRVSKLMAISRFFKYLPFLRGTLFSARKLLPYNIVSPKIWGVFPRELNLPNAYHLSRGIFMPWEVASVMDSDKAQFGLESLSISNVINDCLDGYPNNQISSHATISILESTMYMRNQLLRDADWASMSHSIEVRTPLVDYELLSGIAEHILKLPSPGTKMSLANAPNQSLPYEIATRKKTGFTTPIDRWIKSSKLLSNWNAIPILKSDNCHWSRRHVYSVLELYKSGLA